MRRLLHARFVGRDVRMLGFRGLSRVLVFAMLLSLAFAPAACGDESTVRDPNRGVFKVNRCGKGCE